MGHREQQAQSQVGVAEVMTQAQEAARQPAGWLGRAITLPPGAPTACKCWSLLRLALRQLLSQTTCMTPARPQTSHERLMFVPLYAAAGLPRSCQVKCAKIVLSRISPVS